MEAQQSEETNKFLELLNKGKDFRKLTPDSDNKKSFTVPLKVSCYNELNLMVSDLLKASIVLLNSEVRSLSSFTANTDINVMTLLEIALQLLPETEMELLDDLHKIHLESDAM